MESSHTDVLVIGAGQAGVVLSYYLQRSRIRHVLVEKDRAFSAWNQRWDHFHLNTANWMNVLPGGARRFVSQASAGGLADRHQAMAYFDDYLSRIKPPLVRARVSGLKPHHGSWLVQCIDRSFLAKVVVICSGAHVRPRLPDWQSRLPDSVAQIMVPDYRRANQIKTSRVLVAGSGSSGMQICHDLARSGRFKRVFLARGRNRHFPWRLLGIPIHTIAWGLGLFNIRRDSWLGRRMHTHTHASDPAAPPGPRRLRRQYGVSIKPRVVGYHDGQLLCADGSRVDTHDTTIVWCTGLKPDFGFIDAAIADRLVDRYGLPKQHQGVSALPGLYFLGMRFQSTVGSHILYGIGRDARYIAEHINDYLHQEDRVDHS